MKEKILEALKTKFTGVKDEILDRIATEAAKTVTDEAGVKTYVEGVTFQTIIDAESDRRVTDAQKTAVANYEKKHNIKDGKPVETDADKDKDKDKDKTNPDVPAWAQALLDSNKAMQDRLDKLDGEKTANSRRGQLEALLAEAPDNIKTRYTKDFDRYNFKDDDDFNTWLEDQKKNIEADITEFKSKGGVVTPPKNKTTETKTVNPLVQARIDARAKETVTSAIQG